MDIEFLAKLKKEFMVLSLEIGSDAALNKILESAYDKGRENGHDEGYDQALYNNELNW